MLASQAAQFDYQAKQTDEVENDGGGVPVNTIDGDFENEVS